ncbi:MAG: sensor histidine kinase [Burkholderiales bacterium]
MIPYAQWFLAGTAVLLAMAAVVVHVLRLNWRLKQSKRELEKEIAERRRAEELLAEKENHLRLIIESEPECVKLQTLDGRLLEMNPAGLALVDAEQSEEVVGSSVYRFIAPAFRLAYEALTKRVFQGESGVMEFQIISLKGHRRWLETHAVPLRDAKGETVALLGITRDITGKKRAEEEVRMHNTELAHVSRLTVMCEMASTLAHELNQPLSAISNYTRGCMRRIRSTSSTTEEILAAMELVCVQAERAGDIIRSVRAFVKKGESSRIPSEINDIVRDTVRFAEPEARQHGVGIRLRLAEQLPPVLTDAIQIEQVILNIVRNAIEAMDGIEFGKREIVIETAPNEGDVIEVRVTDTGPGMSSAQFDAVFDPFFTTKPSGMGMGLTISRSIIEAHGGRLWATLNAGGGLTFQFKLPMMSEVHDYVA